MKKITSALFMMSTIFAASTSLHASYGAHATGISSDKWLTTSYAKTKYPIVFSHGMAGFIRAGTDVLGVDYFYQILPDLARDGANVWVTRVSPFNSTEVRAEQFIQQVEEVLALTGKPKVNLIGHSQGGHNVVYVANVMPNRVASATAVASPLKGSKASDFVATLRDLLPFMETPTAELVNIVSKAITWAQGLNPKQFPHNSLGTMESLSVAGSTKFSNTYRKGMPSTACGEGPEKQDGIYFYSFSGTSTVTNPLDLDSLMGLTGLLTDPKGDNDGLVTRCSAKYGKSIRDNYNWNHLDAVNQVLGLTAITAPDPVTVYRQHANRLKNNGL